MKTRRIGKLLAVFSLSLILLCSLTDVAQAKGRGGYKKSSFGTYKIKSSKSATQTYKPKLSSPKIYTPKVSKKYNTVNFLNKSERSATKKREFLKTKGYQKNPPGYEVDHMVPLSKGGADEPYNMQLLPKEMHKQKTKMERKQR